MNVLGTVRFNRKNMSEELRKLEKDAIAMSQDDGCKVAGQKKPVTIQRTVHDHKYLSGHRKTREPVKKPVPVLDCDKGMVGFDRMEQ